MRKRSFSGFSNAARRRGAKVQPAFKECSDVSRNSGSGDSLISHASTILGAAFVALGSLVAFYEYRASIERDRVQRSFLLIEQWERDGYRKTASVFSDFVSAHEQHALESLRSRDVTATAELLLNYTSKKVLEEYNGANHEHIDDLFYFFGKVSLCSLRSFCDSNLLEQYFGDTMLAFRRQTDLIVLQRRARSFGFSQEMDDFLGSKSVP